MRPKRCTAVATTFNVPGTPTAWPLVEAGVKSWLLPSSGLVNSVVSALAGALSRPSIAKVLPCPFARCTIMKPPPPMPENWGSTTFSANWMAAAVAIMIIGIACTPSGVRHRRRGKPFAARAIGKRQRRNRALLADTGLVPVAHAVRENVVQPAQLRRREDQRRIVRRVERLQLAFQDVLRQRPAGDLSRRSALRQPAQAVGLRRIGIADRHVEDLGRKRGVSQQEAEVDRVRRRSRNHLFLRARRVERRLRRAFVQAG